MLIVIAASGNIRKMGALFFSYISYRFTRNMFFISVQEVGIDKKISIIMQEVRRFNKVLKSSVLLGGYYST